MLPSVVTPAPLQVTAPPQALAVFVLKVLASTDVQMRRRASLNSSPLLPSAETPAVPLLTVPMLVPANCALTALANTDAEILNTT